MKKTLSAFTLFLTVITTFAFADVPYTRKLDAVLQIEQNMESSYKFQNKEYQHEIPVSEFGDISITEALTEYKKLAEQNNSDAIYALGHYYRINTDIPKNYEKAFECFSKLDKMGYIPGTHSLAYLYSQGLGVTKDIQKAIKYYEKASAKKFENSLKNLGYLYLDATDDIQDSEKGLYYIKEAAKLKNPSDAKVFLADVYLEYFPNTPLLFEAEKLLLEAEAENNPDVIESFAFLYNSNSYNFKNPLSNDEKEAYYYRKSVEKEAQKIQEDLKRKRELLPYLLEQEKRGVTDCYIRIAECYKPINRVCPNTKNYYEYLEKAANAGSERAMRETAIAYQKGFYFARDTRKAADWFAKAFIANPYDSLILYYQRNLYINSITGLSYYLNATLENNYSSAPGYWEDYSSIPATEVFDYFKMFYEDDSIPDSSYLDKKLAGKILGYLYANGIGTNSDLGLALEYDYTVPKKAIKTAEEYNKEKKKFLKEKNKELKNLKAAVAKEPDNATANYKLAFFILDSSDYASWEQAYPYLKKAAELGNAESKEMLAYWYTQGIYVECDYTKALKLYEESVEAGSRYAILDVIRMYHYGYGTEQNSDKEIEYLLLENGAFDYADSLSRYLVGR